MFACLMKPSLAKTIGEEIYATEQELLQWQRNAEDMDGAAKRARIHAETLASRLKRLRAQQNEITKETGNVAI